jgi:hypothetical protein
MSDVGLYKKGDQQFSLRGKSYGREDRYGRARKNCHHPEFRYNNQSGQKRINPLIVHQVGRM